MKAKTKKQIKQLSWADIERLYPRTKANMQRVRKVKK